MFFPQTEAPVYVITRWIKTVVIVLIRRQGAGRAAPAHVRRDAGAVVVQEPQCSGRCRSANPVMSCASATTFDISPLVEMNRADTWWQIYRDRNFSSESGLDVVHGFVKLLKIQKYEVQERGLQGNIS